MKKNIKILHELANFFSKDDGKSPIRHVMKTIEAIGVDGRLINNWKADNHQYTPSQILIMLLIIPFFGMANIAVFAKSELHRMFGADENVLYQFLNKDTTNWRSILANMTRRIFNRILPREDHVKSKNPTCLVFDDTDLCKKGKCFELLGRIWSHVQNASVVGYKALACVITDGVSSLVYDFSYHGEKGKNAAKPQGFSAKEAEARFSRERDPESHAAKRADEYFQSKIAMVIEMIKRVIRDGVKFDYVLADSWFVCKELISFCKSRRCKINFLGMIKMGTTQYETKEGKLTASTIVKKMTGKARKGVMKHSRKLHMRYFEVYATLGGVAVKLFFFQQNRGDKEWKALITTNTELNAIQAYEIYSLRWCIEVVFHECKGLLGLGKCQSRDFTAQIAHTTLVFMQHNILSYVKRTQAYPTLGGLFRAVYNESWELTLGERIWGIVIQMLEIVSDFLDINTDELVSAIIAQDPRLAALANLFAVERQPLPEVA